MPALSQAWAGSTSSAKVADANRVVNIQVLLVIDNGLARRLECTIGLEDLPIIVSVG